jgi:hypothetical protein
MSLSGTMKKKATLSRNIVSNVQRIWSVPSQPSVSAVARPWTDGSVEEALAQRDAAIALAERLATELRQARNELAAFYFEETGEGYRNPALDDALLAFETWRASRSA